MTRTYLRNILMSLFLLGFVAVVAQPACVESCEHQNIQSCSYACKQTGRSMVKYNRQEGCICGEQMPP